MSQSHAIASPPVIDTDTPADLDVDMVVTIDVGPKGLDRYLKLVDDRRGPLIQCFGGSMTLVSPSQKHERRSRLLDSVVQEICFELDIEYQMVGSTLLRPPGRKDAGIEPDSCYYLANWSAVRVTGDHLDLSINPPPDLSIEVVAGHSPAKALAISQELCIPEVWVHWVRRNRLEFLHLERGQYVPRDRSRSFPFLGPADVLPWLQADPNEFDNRWRPRLRDWVRGELGPRRTNPGIDAGKGGRLRDPSQI